MRRFLPISISVLLLAAGAVTATAAGAAHRLAGPLAVPRTAAGFTSHVFASGARIMHKTAKGRVAISQPDDITKLGKHIYVAFQNGVGPQGQANPAGTVPAPSSSSTTPATWSASGTSPASATASRQIPPCTASSQPSTRTLTPVCT